MRDAYDGVRVRILDWHADPVTEVKRALGWDVRERRERRLGTVLAVLGLGGGTGVCFWALALVGTA